MKLEYSSRLVFIDEECHNLIKSMVVDNLLEILTERRSQTLYNSIKMPNVWQML